ncbi:MAG: MBL fold metallo-hydrolase [Deltaproteobacteria bacterium]|nr:MBL fold metallo-hydrolase [Deltaproteobacteria bacterium]
MNTTTSRLSPPSTRTRALGASGSLGALALIVTSFVLPSACATAHGERAIGGGLVVHTFRREYSNAHVVVGPGGMFMLDAGLEAEAPALDRDLRDHGLDPSRLRLVVLSHGHADHAGGASYFRQRYGTPIAVGRGDVPLLASGHNDTLCPTDGEAQGRLASDQAASYAPLAPDVEIDGALDLEPLTGIPAWARSLSGHTEGSVVVNVGDASLVGDLFRGGIFEASASVHFYMCDLEDNRRDVHTLLTELAPEARVFFPGHFGPIERDAVVQTFGASSAAEGSVR